MHQSSYPQQKPINPINPPAPYMGGKRLLAKTLIERIEKINHQCYAEPFFGMGGVFFRRPFQAEAEVINDVSKDVTTFLKVLQRHFVEFVSFMRWHVTTRSEFDRLKNTDPETLTDIERAARFFYMQKLSFGGKVAGRSYGYSPKEKGRFDITRIEANLEELHERLAAVQIENLDYADFIQRYDRPTTLFYIDPPYFDCENDYGKNVFSKADFENLANILFSIKGKFILSLNDTPEIRKIFKGFTFESVSTTYSAGGGDKSKKVQEVIISF
ncbi:MAG TPA: DNA methyltransferase [Candidatus Riflebacteria bacterium]|nr:DNA methyltransferase [Candidatus Riflebacteria bacterium]